MIVGQKVVCVRDDFRPKEADDPIKGEIYECDGIHPICPAYMHIKGIHKKGCIITSFRIGYLIEWFRPIDETYGEEVCSEIEKTLTEEPQHA
jgi:hypothetical protein